MVYYQIPGRVTFPSTSGLCICLIAAKFRFVIECVVQCRPHNFTVAFRQKPQMQTPESILAHSDEKEEEEEQDDECTVCVWRCYVL